MKKLTLIALALMSSAAFANQPASAPAMMNQAATLINQAAQAGIPSEVLMTCREANDVAAKDTATVSNLVAVMGNASIEARELKITPDKTLNNKVVKGLQNECAKDPDGLLINAVDKTMRALAQPAK